MYKLHVLLISLLLVIVLALSTNTISGHSEIKPLANNGDTLLFSEDDDDSSGDDDDDSSGDDDDDDSKEPGTPSPAPDDCDSDGASPC